MTYGDWFILVVVPILGWVLFSPMMVKSAAGAQFIGAELLSDEEAVKRSAFLRGAMVAAAIGIVLSQNFEPTTAWSIGIPLCSVAWWGASKLAMVRLRGTK